MSTTPIIDLHCDLLVFLEMNVSRTPFDPDSRCDLKNMQKGGVKVQTCAFFTSHRFCKEETFAGQLRCFKTLLTHYSEYYKPVSQNTFPLNSAHDSPVHLLPAIENADILFTTDNSQCVYTNLDYFLQEVGPILYMSLTWNGESSFGGGTGTNIGLKEEGKRLLHYLNGKGIAIDISHASDELASDIFHFIDDHKLDLKVMASHSNFRKVCSHLRNLPDEFALEIKRRQGVIGLNLYNKFICPQRRDYKQIVAHVEHALKLGLEDVLCFGADFFCEKDPIVGLDGGFFDELPNSSCYPFLQKLLQDSLQISEEQFKKITHQNASKLIQNCLNRAAHLSF